MVRTLTLLVFAAGCTDTPDLPPVSEPVPIKNVLSDNASLAKSLRDCIYSNPTDVQSDGVRVFISEQERFNVTLNPPSEIHVMQWGGYDFTDSNADGRPETGGVQGATGWRTGLEMTETTRQKYVDFLVRLDRTCAQR